jgi:hypothetical protein
MTVTAVSDKKLITSSNNKDFRYEENQQFIKELTSTGLIAGNSKTKVSKAVSSNQVVRLTAYLL